MLRAATFSGETGKRQREKNSRHALLRGDPFACELSNPIIFQVELFISIWGVPRR